ncbi:MAG: hypothetical protein ACOYCA_00235 [Eggerthellaceae bacterium]
MAKHQRQVDNLKVQQTPSKKTRGAHAATKNNKATRPLAQSSRAGLHKRRGFNARKWIIILIAAYLILMALIFLIGLLMNAQGVSSAISNFSFVLSILSLIAPVYILLVFFLCLTKQKNSQKSY